MKALLKNLLLPLFGILVCFPVVSQVSTNYEALEKIRIDQQEKSIQKAERVKKYAKETGSVIRQEFEDGSIIELMDVVNGRPVFYKTDNLGAAITTRANQLWQGGSLGVVIEGLGYNKVGIWDGGAVRLTHQEFNNTGTPRVIQVDGVTTLSAHATHVAGTIIAGGVNANAKGMAHKGQLKAYEWTNVESEMASAASGGMEICNHSWGYIQGWGYNSSTGQWTWWGDPSISPTEDYNFGFYHEMVQNWDQIAYSAPYFLITKSSGNDRGEGPANAGTSGVPEFDGGTDGYDCISSLGVAKNILTVGAVNEVQTYTGPQSVVMSSFSSWGPADDGRIKPDIVGKGVNVTSSTSASNTSYSSYNGTSMSSPNVAGSMVLLQQYYQQTHNSSRMRSSTLKALVIHTADEAGSAPGPDYKFGWGLMNTERAATLIAQDIVKANVIDEVTLNNGASYSREITASGTQPLRVTIAWTDLPGTVPQVSLNPRTPHLVNDLDLKIIGPNQVSYYPYKLNPLSPSSAPTTNSKNYVDNVEQVYIANPVAGGTYTILVNHAGTLSSSQVFSIIVSGDEHANTSIVISPQSLSETLATNETSTQIVTVSNTGGSSLNFSLAVNSGANNPIQPFHIKEKAAFNLPTGSDRLNPVTSNSIADNEILPQINKALSASYTEGFDDITTLPSSGWALINKSSPVGIISWFQGNGTIFPAQSGATTSYIGANFNSTSGTGTISNWLLSPVTAFQNGHSFSFWTRTTTASSWPDRLEVRLSSNGSSTNVGTLATDVGDFTTLVASVNPTLTVGGYPETWTQYTVTLSGISGTINGRIGFRYFVTNGGPSGNNSNYIGIDSFTYSGSTTPSGWLSATPLSGTIAAGQSTQITVTFNSTGLTNGTYQGSLVFSSNDPTNPTLTVPVTLLVGGYNFPPPLNLTGSATGTTVNLAWNAPNLGKTILSKVDKNEDISTKNFMPLEAIKENKSQPPADYAEINSNTNVVLIPQGSKELQSYNPQTLLYNNGTFVNSPGTGPGGSDQSVLQSTSLGMSTYGAGVQLLAGNRVADDFTVDEPWNIESFTFYAYQTGSTTASTITGCYVQIWDGNPASGGSIIWGNLTSNLLSSTTWTNCYRVSQTDVGTTRPIMSVVASTNGLTLIPGTYWVDYTIDGSLGSGPWAPPITINGQTTTGNAKQYTSSSASWQDFVDTGTFTGQGFPFLINGTSGGGTNYNLTGYKIYKNGTLINTVLPNTTTFTENNVLHGTYLYGVSATYDQPAQGESEVVTTSITIEQSILAVTPSNQNVSATAGSTSFSVTSNTSWTVTESVSWLTVSPMSGSNNGTLTVNYDANPTTSSRTGQITVTASGGSPSVIVTVTQAGLSAGLTVTPSNQNVSATSGSTSFTVTSNTSWTVTESVSWLTVSPMSGSNNGTLTANYDANPTTSSRTGQITVTASGGSPSVIVTVTQAGLSAGLTVTPSNQNVSATAGSTSFTVTSNTSWTVTESVSWLTVSPMSGSNNGTLTANYDANPTTSSRTGQITVTAGGGSPAVSVTVIQSGLQGCLPPWQPITNLQYNMQVIGQIFIDGSLSGNSGDFVGAFVGNECRGMASPDPTSGLVFLTIGSNTASGDQLLFKVWRSDQCSECPTSAQMTFQNQLLVGTPSDPFAFNCGLEELNLSFGQGYTWFSVNVNPGSMAVSSLFANLNPCQNNRIIGQSSFALYFNGTWMGSLTSISPSQMYKMELCSQQDITIQGLGVPISPINLGAGYTWLGYQPQDCLGTNIAFNGLLPAPAVNNRIIGQTNFAIFFGGSWMGSLTQLCPGKGYVTELSSNSILTYPASSKNYINESPETLISPSGIIPITATKQHNMNIVAQVLNPEGEILDATGLALIAFIGDECRGVIATDSYSDGLLFLTVGSDFEAGELIHFKVWLPETDQMMDIKETIPFEAYRLLGNPVEPFTLSTYGLTGTTDLNENSTFFSEPYPNPFTHETVIDYSISKPAKISLTVFDGLGQKITSQEIYNKEKGKFQLILQRNDLKAGVYHYRIVVKNDLDEIHKTGKLIVW